MATTFLALPTSKPSSPTGKGPIPLGPKAMRGFAFPDGTIAEFVFPKDAAVDLAKASGTTIPASDPACEGRVASPEFSKIDMQTATL